MSYLILQAKQLPPDIVQGFKDGLFVAKLSQGQFNKVWIDYVLEATENKALKGSGGIIGLTLRDNALARWFLAHPVCKLPDRLLILTADRFTTQLRK